MAITNNTLPYRWKAKIVDAFNKLEVIKTEIRHFNTMLWLVTKPGKYLPKS